MNDTSWKISFKDDEHQPFRPSYEQSQLSEMDKKQVHEALATLPHNSRYVLEQYFLVGKTYEEIASTLGITTWRPRRMILSALRQLRSKPETVNILRELY